MFASWLRSLRRKWLSNRSARGANRFSRPQLEHLEDRVVPTFNFGPQIDLAGFDPQGVVTADFNGDNKLDVAYGSIMSTQPGVVKVAVGHGDGTFEAVP